ncbi:MAG: shikimate kinase [Bacteroidota bacterium]|jgi:shikimate kinase
MRIYLVGYMGSGKSFLGNRLAELLGYSFVDTDFLVESEQQLTVSEIFEQSGEAKFRLLEKAVLERTFSMEAVVVATGGGLACQKDVMENMNRMGITVYLKVFPTTVVARVSAQLGKRPLLKGIAPLNLTGHISNHLAERSICYEKSQLTVVADVLSAEQLLVKILDFSGQSR